MEVQKFETTIGGRSLSIETGLLALQANASVTVRYGDTVVLATAVMSKTIREGIDFFPLMVDYEEKLYAAGKIKGSRFIKREGRPSDEAVLSGRLVDRAIRPLFSQDIKNDVQVILTVLSQDDENDADIVALNAASAVLALSDIPWGGPIGGVRIGRINNEWVLNPSYEAREKSELDVVVASDGKNVLMLEAGAREVSEEVFEQAIEFANKHIATITTLIGQMTKKVGKKKSDPVKLIATTEDDGGEQQDSKALAQALDIATEFIKPRLDEYLFIGPLKAKGERKAVLGKLKDELEADLLAKQIGKEKRKKCSELVMLMAEKRVTQAILDEDKRVDGRSLTEVRALSAMVALLPRTHGSGLFQRGETQVLSVVTLGAPGDEQIVDSMEVEYKKRYMHHYNFPPFSVGETSPLRGAGRREIGHGALAERALEPVLPPKETFPYTIRVVSEVLGSNGSSSMGSTCGSSLALMDAGVPITKPVAGIAMGLASDANGAWKVLTDLQDMEDGEGGMDFKIAGTEDGITAIQMDTKTKGLTGEIIHQTFVQAKQARAVILQAMAQVIDKPREQLSPFAPRIYTVHIHPDKIRDLIGPGGKMINDIIAQTGVQIDIEDDGTVLVTSVNEESANKALELIHNVTRVVKAGEVFQGKVTRIMDFGAFVEILPKQEGLVHISKLANHRVERVEDVVHIGDMVTVQVIEIDSQGRLNLAMEGVEGNSKNEHPPHRGSRGSHPRGIGRG